MSQREADIEPLIKGGLYRSRLDQVISPFVGWPKPFMHPKIIEISDATGSMRAILGTAGDLCV